ncbi:protein MCM10 homolog isoform X2 [Clupea harengus]|uniref:Protein MCM10 homolog n=1 Tax=Clupea harengus TaxID=7950 RepID=A0A8M1KIA7_CLUHA|nr:protein MCM10 homolog isoform X2 [Clupea harengus]
MADDDNLDLLLSMFDESPEEEKTTGGGDDLDDLFDNDEDDGDGYVEPEEEENEENEEPEKEEDSHNRSKEDLEAELRRMQEKMQKLQEQLLSSQGGGVKSPPPKPKRSSSTSKSKPRGASTSPSTNSTASASTSKPKEASTSPSTNSTASASTSKPKGVSTSPSTNRAASASTSKPKGVSTSPSTNRAASTSPPAQNTTRPSPPTTAGSSKKPRAAHQPKAGNTSKASNTLKSPPPSGSGQPPTRQGTPRPAVHQDVPVEKFSGLRIRKPRISSIEIEHKMSGRRMIQLSTLPDKLAREKLEDSDWVTFAVLVNKITPQSKNNGKTFSIWKLNDLHDLEVYVSFFLFGNVHTELWKTDTGTVIGILNPNPMKNKEGSNSNEVSLTIDHPQKVLLLGEALDFGTCKARKKNGDPCTQLVNLERCQYCQYHVQAQYKKLSSKRAEIQSGFTGTVPKRGKGRGSLRDRLCQGDFHYGGMSSLACAPNVNGSQPKKPTQSTLTNIVLRAPANGLALKSSEVSGCTEDFKGLLSMPTPGAINIKKHLDKAKTTAPGESPVQSITATDLLKQQKAMHRERILNRQKRAQEIQERMLQNSGKATPPARPVSNGTPVLSQKPHPPPPPHLSDPTTPTLRRGLSEGEDILFDLSPPPPAKSLSSAKMAALRKLHAKGATITKDDPNAVKRKRASGSDIAARVEKNQSSSEGDKSAAGEGEEPVQKKRRDQLDYIQSEEFQRILNAKSQFSWLMGEMEVKVMQDYFEPLVQKEQMEEKMKSIKEQKCRAITCKSCKYTHFKPADRCIQENHDYHWHDAHKRFFKCPCGQRKISLARIPNMACSTCGQFKWERDGMLKEKKGPKIGGELLLTRGEEQPKFLGSMK